MRTYKGSGCNLGNVSSVVFHANPPKPTGGSYLPGATAPTAAPTHAAATAATLALNKSLPVMAIPAQTSDSILKSATPNWSRQRMQRTDNRRLESGFFQCGLLAATAMPPSGQTCLSRSPALT